MRNVLLGLVLLAVVLLAVVATRPPTYHVERSATISAPPATVFAHVNDFHAWAAWSPWGKLDPQMKTTFTGPAAGTGAVYEWAGNDKVGQGRMAVTESEPPARVVIALDFIKPFASSNVTTFTFAPAGEGTRVMWAMDGRNTFMSKAMGLVTSMDKMIGPDFERGLASLKTASESAVGTPADSSAAPSPINSIASSRGRSRRRRSVGLSNQRIEQNARRSAVNWQAGRVCSCAGRSA